MEEVLRNLTWTNEVSSWYTNPGTNYGLGYRGASYSSMADAWASLYYYCTGAGKQWWKHGSDNYNWPYPDVCYRQTQPTKIHGPDHTFRVWSLNTSYEHDVHFYFKAANHSGANPCWWGIDGAHHFDSFIYQAVFEDFGGEDEWADVASTGAVTDAMVETKLTYTSEFLSDPPLADENAYGMMMDAYAGHVEWTFPEDAKLGSLLW